MPMVYGLTIFISAFLLFLVQLIIGKRILPWFGGAPAVWTTCMLFFQILLLAGYGYAHLLTSRFAKNSQVRIHLALLLVSSLVLGVLWWKWGTPVLPGSHWKPSSPEKPTWQILKLLFVSVGLPYFILSATSPLLQRWYSFTSEREGTYRLYALSNVGSMLALLSYPFLIEPLVGLIFQGNSWGILYVAFVIGCSVCGINALRNKDRAAVDRSEGSVTYQRPGWMQIVLWLLLASTTSAMLLAVTNSLCQEVAVVPFLWVLPLAIYLLTFIICFDAPQRYNRRFFLVAAAASSIVVLITALRGIQLGIVPHITSYGIFLFLFCMLCHGELVRLKPATEFLTLFYLMVALGGAIGGIFVALGAPVLFSGYWEFFIVLLVGWILLAMVLARDRTSPFFRGDKLHFYLVLVALTYLTLQLVFLFKRWPQPSYLGIPGTVIYSSLVVALFAVVTRNARFVRSKYWPRISVGLVIFVAECFMLHRVGKKDPHTVTVNRNFYGVTMVTQKRATHRGPVELLQLTHGQINHGVQFLDPALHNKPTGYYAESSGVALAFRNHPRRSDENIPEPLRVGLLGLGVGTLASYAQSNDVFRFYEINPTVVSYSAGADPLFTYLKNCAGKVELVMGDARLSLERELQTPNQFDLLIMDVFSSDSVPVHLLTTEAFEIYVKHLRDEDSIIAVHISNRFLDLKDLVANTGSQFGFKMVVIDATAETPDKTVSRWCLLTRSQRFLEHPEVQKRNVATESAHNLLWSDDYSDLLRLVK